MERGRKMMGKMGRVLEKKEKNPGFGRRNKLGKRKRKRKRQ